MPFPFLVMLFHSSIRKELGRSFGASFVVLVTIVMTMMLIRTLSLATRGRVNPPEIMIVMGYTVLGQLPVILTLCMFIAIVSTLSRMYRDSEMVIWFSSAQGILQFLPPLSRFAAPVLLAVAALSLFVWPWANGQLSELRESYEQRNDIDRVMPGQFQESADGNRVFYIDRTSDAMGDEAPVASNAFIYVRNPDGGESVTSAQTARLQTVDGARFAILENGQRIDLAGDNALRISNFREYGLRVDSGSRAHRDLTATRTLSTPQLLADPTAANRAEFSWRLGLLLAGINFVPLALALTVTNPRAGRSGNLLLALFTFIVYYNLLNLGQSWIARERTSLTALMLMLHGGSLLLGLFILHIRQNGLSPRSHRLRRSAMPPPQDGLPS